MTLLYTDLSHHDWGRAKGELDWRAILAATSPVVCLRASYGDPQGFSPDSPHFREMSRGARAAGFSLVGAYHNLIRGDAASIRRQVDYLRREADAAGCEWVMLDVERYDELLDRGLHPRWSDVRAFYARWREVDDRNLALYLPHWIWNKHMGRPDLTVLGQVPLVASDYGSNPNGTPAGVYAARGGDGGKGWNGYGGLTPTIWQYGSNVDCPGASGQTDCNAYKGTLAQLRALLTGEDEDDMSFEAEDGRRLKSVAYRDRAMLTMAPKAVYDLERDGKTITVEEDNELAKSLNRIEQQGARDEARDAGLAAAVGALTELVKAGGGNVDMAAILASIAAGADRTVAAVAGLQQRVADLSAQLAGAREENAALQQRLANAYADASPKTD